MCPPQLLKKSEDGLYTNTEKNEATGINSQHLVYELNLCESKALAPRMSQSFKGHTPKMASVLITEN